MAILAEPSLAATGEVAVVSPAAAPLAGGASRGAAPSETLDNCGFVGFAAADGESGGAAPGEANDDCGFAGFARASTSSSAEPSGGIGSVPSGGDGGSLGSPAFVAASSEAAGNTSGASSAAAGAPGAGNSSAAVTAAAASAVATLGIEAAAIPTPALTPAELERKKLLEFEAKLEQVAGDVQSLGAMMDAGKPCEFDARSVYVGGLDDAVTSEELQEAFESCGNIQRVTVVMDHITRLCKGFAYVEFADEKGGQNAVLLNGTVVKGMSLKVCQKRIGPACSKGKGKCKGEVCGKDKGDGKYIDPDPCAKGKAKSKDKSKDKGKGFGKYPKGNIVYRPNRPNPYE